MKASPNITARLGLISIPSEIRKDTPPKKATKIAWELPETPHFFGESLDTGYEKKKEQIKTHLRKTIYQIIKFTYFTAAKSSKNVNNFSQ